MSTTPRPAIEVAAPTPPSRYAAATGTARPRPRGLPGAGVRLARLLADRLLPALLFGVAALVRCLGLLIHARRGPSDPSLSAGLVYLLDLAHYAMAFLFLSLISLLFLIRRTPRGGRAGPLPLAVALLGSFIMNVAVLQPATSPDVTVLALADLLMAVGLAVTLYAAASLRDCFGLAPEARGLVTAGAYRFVRHPMYLGEFVTILGTLLPVLAPLPLLLFGLFCILQAGRARLEERVLAAAFPEYAAYRRRTAALLPWPRSRSAPVG